MGFLSTSVCTLAPGAHSTEATYPMMIQAHSFREQPAVVRTTIAFVVFATILCLLFGPIGILYALGLGVLYALIYLSAVAFATLLDSDEY
jgi:hypothetical protein